MTEVVSDGELYDSYVYLLARALVIRQEQIDLVEAGVDYNVIKYNPLGSAEFVNPNFDVANLEAWIAVDDESLVLLEVPPVPDRYYTAQICDEWGEVITNINERKYPDHPHGLYAFVAPGSSAAVPPGARRIELHSHKAKLLGRVELQNDQDTAVEWQHRFVLTAPRPPSIAPVVPLPSFGNQTLIGVELFDHLDAMLAGAGDVSPVAQQMQATARAVAVQAADPERRELLDQTLRQTVIPQFLRFAVTEAGTFRNNWLGTLIVGNYGDHYQVRSAANLVGIWANAGDEVTYYVGTLDADGQPYDGEHSYVLRFGADEVPDRVVNAYWSLMLVDRRDFRAVPNRLDRFSLSSHSPLEYDSDGSLTIQISADPDSSTPESNWLPAPEAGPFSLTFRTYVPHDDVLNGHWFPPPVERG